MGGTLSSLSMAKEIERAGNPQKAIFLQKFFKTGRGEYAEGDRFLGITVPELRKLAKKFSAAPLNSIEGLICSPFNEVRLVALLLLSEKFARRQPNDQAARVRLYLKHRKQVNNWNLVDASAPYILGVYLFPRDRERLYSLARARSLWDRRIAIVSTFYFIRQNDFRDTLEITQRLLGAPEDLLHKACGWMLREVGKRDGTALRKFLELHKQGMPRTMLRYAIERFSAKERAYFLSSSKS